jgi:hypothetical protein
MNHYLIFFLPIHDFYFKIGTTNSENQTLKKYRYCFFESIMKNRTETNM